MVARGPTLRLSQQSAKWKSRRMTSKRGSCIKSSTTAGYAVRAVGAFSEPATVVRAPTTVSVVGYS
jgi:hypothetical protein